MPEQLKIGGLAWWTYRTHFHGPDRLLCRIVMMNSKSVSLRILAATAEQVIESGYGVSELVHTLPSTVEMVTK